MVKVYYAVDRTQPRRADFPDFHQWLYAISKVRLRMLLESLHAIALLDKCWSVLTHIFTEKRTLMYHRRLDQLLMATIYFVAKLPQIGKRSGSGCGM